MRGIIKECDFHYLVVSLSGMDAVVIVLVLYLPWLTFDEITGNSLKVKFQVTSWNFYKNVTSFFFRTWLGQSFMLKVDLSQNKSQRIVEQYAFCVFVFVFTSSSPPSKCLSYLVFKYIRASTLDLFSIECIRKLCFWIATVYKEN